MKTTPLNFRRAPAYGVGFVIRIRIVTLASFAAGLVTVAVGATTWTWTGAVSANWSDPNNWNPVGTPQNGDNLAFGYGSDSHRTMVNDLTSLTVNGLTFANNDYQLNGNPVTIRDYLEALDDGTTDSFTTTINCPLIIQSIYDPVIFETGADGNVFESTGDLNLNGPIILNGSLQLDAYATDFQGGGNGHIRVSGVISGNGDVAAFAAELGGHASSVEFNGTPGNSFSGTLYLGTYGNTQIIFNKSSGTVVSNTVAVGGFQSATSQVSFGDANLYLAGPSQIDNNATMAAIGGHQLHLSGNNVTVGYLSLVNFSGDTNAAVLDTGSIEVGLNGGIMSSNDSESVTPIVSGRINLNGVLPFTTAGSVYAGLDLQATMASAGGIYKYGNNALLLDAINSFSGGTTVYQGIVDVRNNGALGAASSQNFLSGGSMTLRNVTVNQQTLHAEGQSLGGDLPGSLLTCVGSCSWSGPIVLDTNLDVAGDITLSGQIMGSAGIGFFGGGTSVLTGTAPNTYTGITLVRCPLLQLNKPYFTTAISGPLVVGGGYGGPAEVEWLNSNQNSYVNGAAVTLYANGIVNLNNFNESFGPVTFNGGEVDTGTGVFTFYQPMTVNPSGSTAVINGNLNMAGNPIYFHVGDGPADPDLLINAVMSGTSGIFKDGPGTIALAGANTFTGSFFVQAGILNADYDTALGANGVGQGTVVQSGATLRVAPGVTLSEQLSLSGTGVGGLGALNVSGQTTFNSPFQALNYFGLSGATTIRIEGAGSTFVVNSIISGTGPLTKAGPGRMVITGIYANTYTGDTKADEGTLELNKPQALAAVPGNLVVGPGPVRGSQPIARLDHGDEIAGSVVTVNGGSLLDLNGNFQDLSQLNLNDGGSVTPGALNIADSGAVNVGSFSIFGSHFSSSIAGNINLPPNGFISFNVRPYAPFYPFASGPELDVPAFIPRPVENTSFIPAGFSKNGLGQIRLSGNNSFAGPVSINEGALIAASPNALGTSSGETYVAGGASLALDGGVAILNEYVVLDSTNRLALDSRSGANTWGGTIYLNRDSSINVNQSLQAAGLMTGPGSLIKVGPGPLTLGGLPPNTFAGDTSVNEGTLVLQKAQLGTTAIPHNVIVGTGSGPATLQQLNENSIAGSVTVNDGAVWKPADQVFNTAGLQGHPALTLNGTAVVENALLNMPAGLDIVVNPGSNTTATIYGTIGLDFGGTHTVSVASGASQFGSPECLIAASIQDVFGVDNLQKTGAGTLRLTGTNTYTGTNLVDGGTLWVDGPQPQSWVRVNDGARLQGTGTVGVVTFNGSSGVVAPGASPGILTCSNFNAGTLGAGTLQIELNGTTPGTSYDQLNVHGTVTLSGITLSAPSLNFVAALSNQFVIVSNDGTDAVVGTFNGLAQNSSYYVGDQIFRISYTGGDGNDVVLTKIGDVFHPTLSIEPVPPNSVRLLWQTNDPGFGLQSNTNLATANWTPVLPAPVILGTHYVVTNPASGLQKSYRLLKP